MQVIDNFLSQQDYANIKQYVLGSKVHWYFGENVSYGDANHGIKDNMAIDTFGFNRDILNTEINYGDTDALSIMPPILSKILEINGNDTLFKRIRFGMKFHKHNFGPDNYNIPHIDYTFPHKTFILYMNETDGDTFIFDQYYDGTDPAELDFTVKERVKPVENRALILDGYQYHTASNPLRHDTRTIININYV